MSTPREQWPTTEALVYSVDWIDDPSGNDYPHYQVIYSYSVRGERYTGEFRDYRSRQDYLHRDDDISIRYSPEHPSKSYYPDAQTATNRRLLAFGIGAGIAVVVLLVRLLSRGPR